jgi:ribosomal protein S18 acetylase RimI-like enzyme
VFGVTAARLRLRPADGADQELVKAMLADYLFEFDGRTEPYPYLTDYWRETERLPFLIERDSQPIGLCLVRVRNGGWEIAEFTVLQDYRRLGVGRAAVEALAARASDAGALYFQAKVRLDNIHALPFWLSAGFREVSRDDVVVTRRALNH